MARITDKVENYKPEYQEEQAKMTETHSTYLALLKQSQEEYMSRLNNP